jgi:AcrR family transcriptional regulator
MTGPLTGPMTGPLLPRVTRVDDPMTPVGERLAETAGRLFYAHGIRGVGVDLIAAEAGTTKKTLYDRFGSKDALVALCLRRRAERWQTTVLTHLAEQAPEPGPGRVLAVFDALTGWLSEQWRGCAFVNAYAEIGGTEHVALPVVRAEKAWMRQLFTALVEEAGYPDPASLGGQLHLLYEGAIVTLSAGDDDAAVDRARTAATTLLAAA